MITGEHLPIHPCNLTRVLPVFIGNLCEKITPRLVRIFLRCPQVVPTVPLIKLSHNRKQLTFVQYLHYSFFFSGPLFFLRKWKEQRPYLPSDLCKQFVSPIDFLESRINSEIFHPIHICYKFKPRIIRLVHRTSPVLKIIEIEIWKRGHVTMTCTPDFRVGGTLSMITGHDDKCNHGPILFRRVTQYDIQSPPFASPSLGKQLPRDAENVFIL